MAHYENRFPDQPYPRTKMNPHTLPTTCRPARVIRTLATALLSVSMLLSGCGTTPRPTPAPVADHGTTASPAAVRPLPPVSTLPTPSEARSEQPTARAEVIPVQPTLPASLPPIGAPPAQNSALVALLQRAEDQTAAGQLESAASSLERALRIDAEDPEVWHELAQVRLRQQDLEQARDLARKSNSLATGRPGLQARNWRLIAVVLKLQGDNTAADHALDKARVLEQAGD